jgi:hypothetical protein
MLQRLGPMALALACTALFAAGCGGDDNKSDNSSAGSTPAATATTDSSSSSSDSTDVSNNPQVKAAVAQCKSSIDANPAVKDDIKNDLKDICDKAASGKPEDVKQAIKDVCTKIVESSVPSGSAQDQAKAACDQAGG